MAKFTTLLALANNDESLIANNLPSGVLELSVNKWTNTLASWHLLRASFGTLNVTEYSSVSFYSKNQPAIRILELALPSGTVSGVVSVPSLIAPALNISELNSFVLVSIHPQLDILKSPPITSLSNNSIFNYNDYVTYFKKGQKNNNHLCYPFISSCYLNSFLYKFIILIHLFINLY